MQTSIYHRPSVQFGAGTGTHARLLDMVGFNKSVLEVGCNTGYLSMVMQARGCDVVGIELDENAARLAQPFCKRVIVANVETLDWQAMINQKFDVITFGDVLEHLSSPQEVLKNARNYLEPDGYIVISVPNIAYGSVALSLLMGQFNYTDTGILDKTHLRFFTKRTALNLIQECGFNVRRAISVFEPVPAEVQQKVLQKYPSLTPDALYEILNQPESQTFQYVFMAELKQQESFSVSRVSDKTAFGGSISVVIHYNGADVNSLVQCFTAIAASKLIDPLCVNIISPFSPVTQIVKQDQWYTYSGDDGIYSKINELVATINTDITVLIDASVSVSPTSFSTMVKQFQQNPTTAVIGGGVLQPDGRTIVQYGGYLSPPTAHISNRAQHHFGDDGLWDETTPVDFVFPEFLAFRTTKFKEINGFETDFKTIYAVVDFCQRMWHINYQVIFNPNMLSVLHIPQPEPTFEDLRAIHIERLRFASRQLSRHRADDFFEAEKNRIHEVRSFRLLVIYRWTYFHFLQNRGDKVPREIWEKLYVETVKTMKQKEFSKITPIKLHKFNSTTPLVGNIITLMRRWWGNIAARWLVEDLIKQQNAINQNLSDQLQEMQERLFAQEKILSQLVEMIANHNDDPD